MIPLGRPRRRPRPSSSVAQDRIEDEGRGGGRGRVFGQVLLLRRPWRVRVKSSHELREH